MVRNLGVRNISLRNIGLHNINLRGVFNCSFVCGFCSLMLLSTVAWAQALPLIKLSDLSLEAGDTLTVTASDLVPEAIYTLTLTNEDGDEIPEKVQADAQGDLTFATQLGAPGHWQLNVQGSGLDARFEVEVTEAVQNSTCYYNSGNGAGQRDGTGKRSAGEPRARSDESAGSFSVNRNVATYAATSPDEHTRAGYCP